LELKLEIGIPKIGYEIGIPKIGFENSKNWNLEFQKLESKLEFLKLELKLEIGIPKIGIEIGNWNSKNWLWNRNWNSKN
jgi:hypothetical protein